MSPEFLWCAQICSRSRTSAHLNTRWAILFNACIWIAAYVIALALFRHYSGVKLTPIPVLAIGLAWFSFADLQNALWAFEVGWFLVVLGFLVMLFALLVPETHRSLWIAVAIVAAVVSTLSWIQGFVAWPIGVVCLVWCRSTGGRFLREFGTWLGAALATTVLYLIGYSFNQSSCSPYFGCTPTNPLTHPIAALHFYLVLIGNVIPGGFLEGTPHNYLRFVLVGLLVLFASGWIIVQSWRFRQTTERVPLPMLLIGFALLVDLTIMWGRLGGGLFYAVGGNRYVLPNIVLLAGIVMYAWTHRPWSEVVRGETSLKMVLR